jgi:RNA recognition motif-containing protein
MNIYIGNLPYTITEDELKESFNSFGEVSSVNIITDRFSGQSKGFGFVEMPEDTEAEAAIKALDGQEIKGRNLKVNQARPRRENQHR